jgi:alpha-galactosidase
VLALDIPVRRGADQSEFVLHHHTGSLTTPNDYAPAETALGPGLEKRLGATGGRPLNAEMPYVNLEWAGQGLIVALGWPGQWFMTFARDAETGLRLAGGQEQTHFRLRPGEEVRTPLVVLQFWQGGDRVRSQNLWRRWMVAHCQPRPGGQPMPPVFSGAAADVFPNLVCGQADEIPFIQAYPRHGLRIDYWWRDAGWYPCAGAWWNTGTWEPDPKNYPDGLRAVADAAHANGMKFIVWFEPERAVAGSWLAENHPEWILGGKQGGLLDLGNPDAWRWLVEHVDRMITTQGIDMYRQDFNMDPLPLWRANDAPDRQGITENHHVTGLLAYWDELHRRHPGMPIDCCASGGRRNEVEAMRRAVPLSKSDLAGGTTSTQCQTYGIASWLPYYGAGMGASEDLHVLRCNLGPWSAVCWDTRREDLNYDVLRRIVDEWRRVAPYFSGDFYPLTPYSLAEDVWMAWQFDVPEKGEGVVQIFRRTQCAQETAVYPLRGLGPGSRYVLTDFDVPEPRETPGRELLEKGLEVTLPRRPWAALITYRKAP